MRFNVLMHVNPFMGCILLCACVTGRRSDKVSGEGNRLRNNLCLGKNEGYGKKTKVEVIRGEMGCDFVILL